MGDSPCAKLLVSIVYATLFHLDITVHIQCILSCRYIYENHLYCYLSVFDLSIFSYVILARNTRNLCYNTKASYLVTLFRGTETQITRV